VAIGALTGKGHKEVFQTDIAAIERCTHDCTRAQGQRRQLAGKRLPQRMLGDLGRNDWSHAIFFP
jgi:hypothetical protein